MHCIAVINNTIIVSKGSVIDCCINAKHNIINLQDSIGADEYVCDIAISNDSKYLAILTSAKNLIVYELTGLQLSKSFILPRSASKIRFGVANTHIFVADKTGDVLFYDLLSDEGGTKLLGHLSLLLNVLQSKDGNYLISSDRDEKIRVSSYPNTYNIQTYCLGHKEFVNHIEFLPHDDKYLISASGDGSVKCWDFIKGHLSCTIETKLDISDQTLQMEFKKIMDENGIEVDSLPIVHLSATKLNGSTSLIAVTVHSLNSILIYSLETAECKVNYKLVDKIVLNYFPACIQFYNMTLFVFDSRSNSLAEFEVLYENDKVSITMLKTISMFDEKETTTVIKSDFEYIKVLFKRKFDNVQEYQERKKNRIEKLS
ncbi:tRNA (guanine-N(7)-)-methyltransferase non-catalytic subunit wuho [Zerene cesonia]|uniref:tRNA (guanine-N(7)-)-methyltransferase non-catalytic subunit wuho n=1 Tax=Zerene cesonia TaxID=33412 RepID=UPI0018E5756D|nr:tRNA (guanine-N(7)-)-methyltransferase non-catalytic subunit wuho [Zerene cesonia]